MIDAGIHVCIAAGNNYHKADVTTGLDYDNNLVAATGTIYYNRGSSPFSEQAHMVGNIDRSTNFRICNIGGTSMASPQIAGVVALYAQLNPSTTPAQGIAYINTTAKVDLVYTTGLDNDYTNHRSIKGGPNRFAFNKFNSSVQLTIG